MGVKFELSRRKFITSTVATIAAVPAARDVLAASPAALRADRRPNVIMIMLDDLGSVDANCYGSNDLVTPNLDALAASGVRFTQCCSAAPVCSPSRAAVMTGRYPQRAGLSNNASSQYGRGAELDELIGRVLEKLRQLGLAEHTIIGLQSDHGHSTEERTFGGGGSAGPYRGAKYSMFEGGIRVVSMISWAGTLPQGAVRTQLVSGCDWLPTMAELTDVPLPDRRLDGRSMLPVIRSADAPTQHPVRHWQLANQWAVREGPWKLIGNPRDTSEKAPITPADTLFLSNLETDVSEMRNLAREHPDIVSRLSRLHDEWVEDVKDRS